MRVPRRSGVGLAAIAASIAVVACSEGAPRNPDPLTARLAAYCGVASASFDYTGSEPSFAPFDIRDWWSANGNYEIQLTRSTIGPGRWYVSCNGGPKELFTLPPGQDPANTSG